MIEKETVLVLGAGTSIPYGFPIGKSLKDEIYTTVVNSKNIILNELATPDVLKRFIDGLKYSPEESIDAFLEHETDEKIIEFGKKAIVATLLPYEKEEYLFNHFISKDEGKEYFNWYRYLWNQMNTSFDDFEKNLSIITFNYDRSLEFYLYTALKHKFPGKKEEEYKNKLDSITIIHIYGKLGYLPWESKEDKKTVPYNYSFDNSGQDIRKLYENKIMIQNISKEIKIIHEEEKIENPAQIRILLKNAKRIFFLGFGFNPINLERLFGDLQRSDSEIRGTMYNMSLSAKRKAQRILKNFQTQSVWNWEKQFPDTTIYDFLYNHITL